jgi:nitrogen fixation protein FixH
VKFRLEAWWPIAIVGVLVATVGANVAAFIAAVGPQAATVEPDYYRKAVEWDSTLAQRERNAALGWRIDAVLGDVSRDGATLEATLLDPHGAPLDGADVRVEALHNRDGAHPVAGRLEPAGAGRYAARLPLRRAGLWELRFDVRRQDRRFTSTQRKDVAWMP